MDQTVVLTVLALIASVLSAGGIVGQLINYRKTKLEKDVELQKLKAEAERLKTTSSTEMAAFEVNERQSQREATGQFQKTLLERMTRLEKERTEDSKRIRNLERDNTDCERRYSELDGAFGRLAKENEELRAKVNHLESDNASLRRKTTALEVDVRQIKDERAENGKSTLRSETVLKAAPAPGKEPK